MASTSAPQIKLLIAEDDREIAELLNRYFQARGVGVVVTPDGEQAWRSFVETPPDVVLTDLMMPKVSGRDLIVRIRTHPTRARTPVILMAAGLNNAKDEADIVAQLKVEAAFRKPLGLKELYASVAVHAEAFNGRRRTAAPEVALRPPTPRAAVAETLRAAAPRSLPVVVHVPAAPALGMVASELVRLFETRANALVRVTSGSSAREITFADGLVVDVRSDVPAEREGTALVAAGLLDAAHEETLQRVVEPAALVETAVQLHAVKPSRALIALEQHARTLLTRALAGGGAIASMDPPPGDPQLCGRFRLDPIQRVMAACLQLTSEDVALAALQPHAARRVHRGSPFNERVMLLTRLRPLSQTPAFLLDVPTVEEALQRVRTSPEGVRELLALVLSQTVVLGGPDQTVPPCPRAAALTHMAEDWDATHLSAHGLAIREAVAREWIRTNASIPRQILNVGEDEEDAQVRLQHGVHTARFGPPALDDADLGPAKTYLAMVRMRRDAALRAVLRLPP